MTADTPNTESKQRKPLTGAWTGMVTSDKRDKTRTVTVDWQTRHAKYGKYLKRSTKLQVHDEANQSKLGDSVEIVRCRPVSKTKCWRLLRVVQAAPAPAPTH
jgi:small subunit ribosomal protein S17